MNKERGLLAAGILGVAAPAGISFATGNIWSGFITAFIFGVVYLIVVDRKLVRTLEKPGHRIAIRSLITALILAQTFAAYMVYDRSQFIQDNLAETRSSIDEGVSKVQTQQAFLDTFVHYYDQADQTNATIASSFRVMMGDRLHDDGTVDFSKPGVNGDIIFKYEIVSPDEVVITASAKIGKGENPEFVNESNETGKYQAVATLTPNGIDYEREN